MAIFPDVDLDSINRSGEPCETIFSLRTHEDPDGVTPLLSMNAFDDRWSAATPATETPTVFLFAYQRKILEGLTDTMAGQKSLHTPISLVDAKLLDLGVFQMGPLHLSTVSAVDKFTTRRSFISQVDAAIICGESIPISLHVLRDPHSSLNVVFAITAIPGPVIRLKHRSFPQISPHVRAKNKHSVYLSNLAGKSACVTCAPSPHGMQRGCLAAGSNVGIAQKNLPQRVSQVPSAGSADGKATIVL
ncbi:hypothetical protein A0H81_00039 [Grifola frondosa]|uniref:Uncharacterized protein n=1 Tax=Grifola frondosa TaxID=5627 RepID=A0A1C7MR59_GRIFR|nr:hypothetical protein A0H81_00039 [Grifola frondosa]